MLWVKGESGEVPEAEGVTYTLPRKVKLGSCGSGEWRQAQSLGQAGLPRSHGASGYNSEERSVFFFYKSEVCPINLPSFQTMRSLHTSETLGTIHN